MYLTSYRGKGAGNSRAIMDCWTMRDFGQVNRLSPRVRHSHIALIRIRILSVIQVTWISCSNVLQAPTSAQFKQDGFDIPLEYFLATGLTRSVQFCGTFYILILFSL